MTQAAIYPDAICRNPMGIMNDKCLQAQGATEKNMGVLYRAAGWLQENHLFYYGFSHLSIDEFGDPRFGHQQLVLQGGRGEADE